MKVKTGVLMLNMGGPSSAGEVQPFLTRLFTDTDIIRMPFQNTLGPLVAKRRTPKIVEKYEEIGGGSPIRRWTEKQGKLMVDILNKTSPATAPHKFYVGFRYAEPLTEDTLDQMEKDGVEHAVAFPQYPQYSCSTSGSSLNAIAKYYLTRTVGDDKTAIRWSIIDRWPVESGLITAFVELIRTEIAQLPASSRDEIVILFSAHALPQDAVNAGDTYPCEVAATVLRVMESLDWKYPYRLVWQSKVGPIRWLEPQTDDAIKGFVSKGFKNFILVPISFVNEHIETLHELDIEYGKELAQKLRIENIRRCPAPNDHPAFIKGLAETVRKHLEKDEVCSKQLLVACPKCSKSSCFLMRQWIAGLETK